jgi:nucleoside-diphosphate-sugar epimerase
LSYKKEIVKGLSLGMIEQEYIWIIGATGFVGKKLAKKLIPNSELVCFGNKRLDLELMEESNLIMSPLEDFDYDWFLRFPPKVIFHCARLAGSSPAKRLSAARKGAIANQKMIDFIQDLSNPPIVVYCSGTLMYGNQKEAVNETGALNPIAYAEQYQIAEKPWLVAQKQSALDIRFARPAWILGTDSWFYHYFLKPAFETGTVPYYGTGQQQMSILSVEDCAGQLFHCYRNGSPKFDYNLYSFAPITQIEFAQKIGQHLHLETEAISYAETEKRFGQTEAAALCSNIPVYSQHQDWKAQYHNQFDNLDALLIHALAEFKKEASMYT